MLVVEASYNIAYCIACPTTAVLVVELCLFVSNSLIMLRSACSQQQNIDRLEYNFRGSTRSFTFMGSGLTTAAINLS